MSTVGFFRTPAQEGIFRSRVNDLAIFTRLQRESGDIDPVYPVLRNIIERRRYNVEEALWLVELYLCYYNLSSALTAFRAQPWPPGMLPGRCLKLPTGIERRGLRDPHCMIEHIASYTDIVGPHGEQWIMRDMWPYDAGMNHENFLVFWERAQTIKHNGRWAAFKWTELLMRVLDFPFAFPDMRLEQCSGPREGLEWLYSPAPAKVLNVYAENLRYELRIRLGYDLPWEQLETMLCDFNSMRKGNYYPGKDIDEMLEQIHKATDAATLHKDDLTDLMAARKEVFPRSYLGEWQGWNGISKERKRLYERTGKVESRV